MSDNLKRLKHRINELEMAVQIREMNGEVRQTSVDSETLDSFEADLAANNAAIRLIKRELATTNERVASVSFEVERRVVAIREEFEEIRNLIQSQADRVNEVGQLIESPEQQMDGI